MAKTTAQATLFEWARQLRSGAQRYHADATELRVRADAAERKAIDSEETAEVYEAAAHTLNARQPHHLSEKDS